MEKKLATNNLQIISVSVQLKKSKLLISCLYIPPNATTFETFEILDQYLDELVVQPETHQVICGDFNVNMIQKGIKQKRLRNGNNLDIPKLTPTRETASSKSCLDVFFSHIPLKITLDQSDISDHHTVLATLNTNFKVSCKESNTFSRKWKALENENVLKEAQEISELHSSLMITLDKFCPMKEVKPSERKNWIDNEIKNETTKINI